MGKVPSPDNALGEVWVSSGNQLSNKWFKRTAGNYGPTQPEEMTNELPFFISRIGNGSAEWNMDLAIHEAPLDNSFQKQKRELASKGSLGRRRRPTRSNLRTFCDSLVQSSEIKRVKAKSQSSNEIESLSNGDTKDHISPGPQPLLAHGDTKEEGKSQKVARKGSVLIQTWERRSLGEKTSFVLERASSLGVRKKTLDPTEACPATYTFHKELEIRTFDSTEDIKCADLPEKRLSVSKEIPTNTASKPDVRARNGVNCLKNTTLSNRKDEPEWISLSRKLCAKFIESHLDEKGEETELSSHDLQDKPVRKAKFAFQDTVRDKVMVSANGQSEEPQWIHLSKKLCTKFLEQHFEYSYNASENHRSAVPCSESPKEIPRKVQITEKFPKGSSKDRGSQKEEPEWISLSKKLRAKFIEGHLDDPDKVSFDSQLNASDLEENFSVPALAKKYLECRQQQTQVTRNSVGLHINQATERQSGLSHVYNGTPVNSSLSTLSRSMPDLSSKERGAPEDDQRTSLSEGGTEYFPSTPQPWQNHSKRDHLFPGRHAIPGPYLGGRCDSVEQSNNEESCDELENTKWNSLCDEPTKGQARSGYEARRDWEEGIRERTVHGGGFAEELAEGASSQNSFQRFNGNVRKESVTNPPGGFRGDKSCPQGRDCVHVDSLDERDLSVHFDEEISYEDMESFTSPINDGDRLIKLNSRHNNGFQGVTPELKSTTTRKSDRIENINNGSQVFSDFGDYYQHNDTIPKKETVKKVKSFQSIKHDEDFCSIRFRIIPGKPASSKQETKCGDRNGIAKYSVDREDEHETQISKSNCNARNMGKDIATLDSGHENFSPTCSMPVANGSGFPVVVANERDDSENYTTQECERKFIITETNISNIETNFKSQMSQTIGFYDSKESDNSLEKPDEFSIHANYLEDKSQTVFSDDYDQVENISEEAMLCKYGFSGKDNELPGNSLTASKQEEILNIRNGEDPQDDETPSNNREVNFRRNLKQKGEILQKFNLTESGNLVNHEPESGCSGENLKTTELSNNAYVGERNQSHDKQAENTDSFNPNCAAETKRLFMEREKSETTGRFATHRTAGEMNSSMTYHNEIRPFNTSSDSPCYRREANFDDFPTKMLNSKDKKDFKIEHLYMNYSTEYGKLRKTGRMMKDAFSDTSESLNSTCRAKSLGSLMNPGDYNDSETRNGSFSDSPFVRVISAEVLNCDSSYRESRERGTPPVQITRSSSSKTGISPFSTSSKRDACGSRATKTDDEFFKDTTSTSVCPSDSESSSWTMTETNSYVINCSSSANESDLSDCSMSVKCGQESKDVKGTAEPDQRSPSLNESGFYVSFKDSSDNDDNFNKIGSYCSKKEHEVGKRRGLECQKNASIPQSLRHLFDIPTSSMTASNLHSSRLLMSKEPPSLFSSVSQLSRPPHHRDGAETKKTKKSERSSSVKIRDIAQGIILTFRKFHSGSSKQSHLSPNHYVDVSHLAESTQKNSTDWVLGKSMVSPTYALQPSGADRLVRFDTAHPFFKGREYATPNAKDMGTQSVRSWTKLKPGSACNSRVHTDDVSHNGVKGKALVEEKRRKEGKISDGKKKKRSKDKDRSPHGKTRQKRPEANSIPNISRKIQQMEDGTFYLVTTVSGNSPVPALYSESVEPGKERFPEPRRTATGESNC